MAKMKLGIILPKSKAEATDVVAYGKSVASGMTTHAALYPDPIIPIKDLDEAVKSLEASILPENKRSKESNIFTENEKQSVLSLLSTLSNYVLLKANGNRATAAVSGFTLTKEERNSRYPSALEIKKRTTGVNPGTVRIVLEDRAGCAFFLVMLRGADGNYTIIDGFSTTTFTITGLPSGESALRIYGKKGDKVSPNIDVLVRAS